MSKRKEQADSVRSRVSAALERVGLLPEDDNTKDTFVHLVRSVFEKNEKVKNLYTNQIPTKVLENIALLKIAFGFNNVDIVPVILGDQSKIDRALTIREREITLLADAYAHAKSRFALLRDTLASGEKDFEEIDLRSHLALERTTQNDSRSRVSMPLHMARALENVRWSDGFQNGDSDAICLAAENYMAAGALEIAEPLIEQVLEADPNHPGGWFQKARLLLKKSTQAMRHASHFHFLSEEADALSATERHYEELAHDEVDTSQNLRQKAFDACLRAYSLLPDGKNYEHSAIQWSVGYDTLRSLRVDVMLFIVREAGERCNPYRLDGIFHDRIEARLGRTKKRIWHEARKAHEWVSDVDEMTRLAADPLFSECADKTIIDAYTELMGSFWYTSSNRTSLRLSALNFLRLLMPDADYRREVAVLVETLRSGHALISGEYFGPFSDTNVISNWRLTLHEHLDSIMSRAEQRDLVRIVYAGWCAQIDQRRDDALLSIYDDEIRLKFSAADPLGAYKVACMGEADGIYRRDDGYGSLVLRRTAQHATRNLRRRSELPQSIIQHLSDDGMKKAAEDYYNAQFLEWDVLEGSDPFPDYLWAPGNDLNETG